MNSDDNRITIEVLHFDTGSVEITDEMLKAIGDRTLAALVAGTVKDLHSGLWEFLKPKQEAQP